MRSIAKSVRRIVDPVVVSALAGFSAAQAQELDVINVMTSNDLSCSPYPQIASNEFGFFADEGIKLNLLSSATAIPYVAFLANGDADLAMLDAGQILQAANSGQPIAAIYEAYQQASDGIATSAGSEVKSVSDLKGRTIGMASNRDQLSTVIALSTVGMKISDIETVIVGESGPVVAQALKDNKIQAYAASITEFTALSAAGMPLREITPIELAQVPGNTWTAWKPTLEEKRPLLERFLRAWAKGQHAGVLDVKAVMSACKKRLPEQWEEPGRGEKIVSDSASILNLRRTVLYGEPQPDVWEAIQDPYISNGEIDKKIDITVFLDDSFIAAANNFKTADVKRGIKAWKEANKESLLP